MTWVGQDKTCVRRTQTQIRSIASKCKLLLICMLCCIRIIAIMAFIFTQSKIILCVYRLRFIVYANLLLCEPSPRVLILNLTQHSSLHLIFITYFISLFRNLKTIKVDISESKDLQTTSDEAKTTDPILIMYGRQSYPLADYVMELWTSSPLKFSTSSQCYYYLLRARQQK